MSSQGRGSGGTRADQGVRPTADEDGAESGEDQAGDHEPGAADEGAGLFAEPADGVGAGKAAEVSERVDDADARGGGCGAEETGGHGPDRAVRGHDAAGGDGEKYQGERHAGR